MSPPLFSNLFSSDLNPTFLGLQLYRIFLGWGEIQQNQQWCSNDLAAAVSAHHKARHRSGGRSGFCVSRGKKEILFVGRKVR